MKKNTLARILCVILTVCMLLGVAPMGGLDLTVTGSAADGIDWSTKKTGDTIEFGSYPQSKVTDSDLITAIEAAGESIAWVDYNYYAGTGDWYDGNMKPVAEMMLYKDISYNGSKYRVLKINQYRPYMTSELVSEANSIQDDNGYYTGNTYYFKYEPLTWRVLDPDEGYVMCNQIIDSQAYHNFMYKSSNECYNSKDCTAYASDWVTSSLRKWLNNDFYNTAFTSGEKAQIGISPLENKSTKSSTYDSGDTSDKIFPISYNDARNSNYGFTSNRARWLKGTDYAKCQGLSVISSYGGNSWWWLRSPDNSTNAKVVCYDGEVVYYSGGVYTASNGIVPAFKFNPKYNVGDTIEFGSYPQSKVTDSDLITAIEAAGESIAWVDYNYYAGTGSADDGEMNPVAKMMLYKDISCNGSKYRAVKINQLRPYGTGWTSSSQNSYQDNNGFDTGRTYYFKYEPLTWRVLDPSEGYVMCNSIIDSQAYQNFIYKKGNEYYNSKDCTAYASDWVTSSLRQWLNNDFYNTAFTSEEKAQIGISHLENKSTNSSTYDSADTYDKIFPISYNDAINSNYGFNSSDKATDTARQLKGTDYAKCQGLNVKSSSGGTSEWCLRSSDRSNYAVGVRYDGLPSYIYIVYYTYVGIVPAFKFNPTPVSIPVSYELDGGAWTEGYTAPASYMSNKALALPTAENLTKTGYSFVGWELLPTSGATQIYKAKWKANQYTLTFVLDNGENDVTVTQDYGTTVTAPTPQKKGHEFIGWDKTVPATMPAENVTYTAQWEINEYTLTFVLDNGENDVTITQDYGTAVIAPTPTKTGYIFKGWDKTVPTTMPAENATYTAQWEECDHSGNTNPTSCSQDTECSVCGGTIAADPHSYGSDWKYDETDHWHECVNGCGTVTDKAKHTFEWVTDKEPTESETGVAHEECTVCHATRNENTVVERNKTKWEKMYDCFISFIVKIIKKVFELLKDIC